MIKTETFVNFDGRELVRTYSDCCRYVCRDGQMWDEAIDPPNTGRVYTEGELITVDGENISSEDALSIITGGET